MKKKYPTFYMVLKSVIDLAPVEFKEKFDGAFQERLIQELAEMGFIIHCLNGKLIDLTHLGGLTNDRKYAH